MDDPAAFDRCWCTGVDRSAILAAIAAGCRSVEELRRRTGACSGCGTCRPELQALLDLTVQGEARDRHERGGSL